LEDPYWNIWSGKGNEETILNEKRWMYGSPVTRTGNANLSSIPQSIQAFSLQKQLLFLKLHSNTNDDIFQYVHK